MSDQQLQDEQAMVDMDYSEPVLSPPEAWKKILRPITIFQILQAEPSPFFEDKALVIEGRGFGYVSVWLLRAESHSLNCATQVTLVAHVISVKNTGGGVSYCLEDGTGRITAVQDLDSLVHLHGLSPEAEKEERAQCSAL